MRFVFFPLLQKIQKIAAEPIAIRVNSIAIALSISLKEMNNLLKSDKKEHR